GILVLGGPRLSATVPGEPEMQARLGGAVQLPGRLVVTHAIDLVVREPELAVLGVEVHSHRVADAAREDLAPGAVEGVQADDAADAHLRAHAVPFLRPHVERLPHLVDAPRVP